MPSMVSPAAIDSPRALSLRIISSAGPVRPAAAACMARRSSLPDSRRDSHASAPTYKSVPATRPERVSAVPASASASGTSSSATAASSTPPPNAVSVAAVRSGRRTSAATSGAGHEAGGHDQAPADRGSEVRHRGQPKR